MHVVKIKIKFKKGQKYIFRQINLILTAGLSMFITLVEEFWKALLNWDLESMAAVPILSQQLELL